MIKCNLYKSENDVVIKITSSNNNEEAFIYSLYQLLSKKNIGTGDVQRRLVGEFLHIVDRRPKHDKV